MSNLLLFFVLCNLLYDAEINKEGSIGIFLLISFDGLNYLYTPLIFIPQR